MSFLQHYNGLKTLNSCWAAGRAERDVSVFEIGSCMARDKAMFSAIVNQCQLPNSHEPNPTPLHDKTISHTEVLQQLQLRAQ